MNKDTKSSEQGLFFLKNSGESQIGINNAFFSAFKDRPYWRTARETVQNSKDAAADPTKPVKVFFKLKKISTSDIPGHNDLLKAWENSEKEEKNPKDKVKDIYKNAIDALKKDTVSVLTISDQNTIGLTFIENDNKCALFNLIKNENITEKPGQTNPGGSYGHGKFAPFTVSDTRTIFYSTHYKDDEGVVRDHYMSRTVIRNHIGENGEHLMPTGFYGKSGKTLNKDKDESVVQPISDINDFPEWLKPIDPNEYGTALNIIGFDESPGWKEKIKASLLVNFFVALVDGKIEFEIDGVIINDDNISDHFNDKKMNTTLKKSDPKIYDDFIEAQMYFLAYQSGQKINFKNEVLGDFEISLYSCPEKETKFWEDNQIHRRKVCFVRNGIKITEKLEDFGKAQWQFRNVPYFFAVVICKDAEGNQVLRDLENNTHDQFQIELIEQGERREKIYKAMRKLGDEIKNEIQNAIGIKVDLTEGVDAHFQTKYFGSKEGKKRGEDEYLNLKLKILDQGKIAIPKTIAPWNDELDDPEIEPEDESEDKPEDENIKKTALSSQELRIIPISSEKYKFSVILYGKPNSIFDLSFASQGDRFTTPIEIINADTFEINDNKIMNISLNDKGKAKFNITIGKETVVSKFSVYKYENR